MQSLRRICAVFIGLVFAVSSVFKLMDPVGTGFIVEGYFQFMHIGFLKPAAKFIGVVLSLCEATICVALITGVWQKITAIATMSLLSFFTVLSVFLVIFNPDMSCGCFGKVLELTHTQTLVKNIVLLALSALAFLPLGKLGKIRADRYVSFGIAEIAFLSFAVYSLVKIPVQEHSAYSPSHTIVSEQANDAGTDYDNPTLPFWNEAGDYCSELLLDGRVVAVSIPKPEKMDASDRNTIASFVQDASNAGWTVLVLASGPVEIPGTDVYTADYKQLITFNRSNGGVVFMENGYIIRKYAKCDYPSFEDMEKMYGEDAVEMYMNYSTRQSLVLQGFSLAVLAVMFFI